MPPAPQGEGGRFVSLTSERARELQQKSVEARRRSPRTEARASKLLEDLAGLSWEMADESLRTLAVAAVSGGGGAVTAHRLLLQRLGRLTDSAPQWDAAKGDPCPTCGGQTLVISLTADDYERFERLRQEEDDGEEEEPAAPGTGLAEEVPAGSGGPVQ